MPTADAVAVAAVIKSAEIGIAFASTIPGAALANIAGAMTHMLRAITGQK